MRNGNNKCTLCPSGFFGKNTYTMRSVMIKDFYTNFCGTRKTSSTPERHRPPFFKQTRSKVNSIDGAIDSYFSQFSNDKLYNYD